MCFSFLSVSFSVLPWCQSINEITQTLKQSGVPDYLKFWWDQISLVGLELLKTQCPGSHMSHQNSFPIIFGNLEFLEILMSFGISEGNLVIFEKSPWKNILLKKSECKYKRKSRKSMFKTHCSFKLSSWQFVFEMSCLLHLVFIFLHRNIEI